jgi:glutamate/tyrosine decarboxylase-like PLP-dependent enzyme
LIPSLPELRAACAGPLPYPDEATLESWARQVTGFVLNHHATLPEQPIGLTASRPQLETRLAEPLPEQGQPFEQVLQRFQQHVYPFAFRVNHPRFLAFIPSAPSFVSILGDWLCAGLNFFAGVWLEAAGPTEVELVVLDWFRHMLGLPAGTQGILTSGGSEANLTALVVARDRLPEADRAKAVVYTGEQRHWSVDRALRIIGLRPDQLRALRSEDGRLTARTLAAAVAEDRAAGRLPWVVVANAGATSTGVVDPMGELADACRDERLWLHVDAAYGWSAALLSEGREVLAGIERADSVTLDPHKWLAQTFEVGCLLVREGELLRRTFAIRPEYMQDVEPGADEVNFCDCGLALTRRFRALKVWLSMQVLGVGWFRQFIGRCCSLARYAEALLTASGPFEISSPASLSIVCFRHAPRGMKEEDLNRHNLALAAALRDTGRAFLSTTRLGDRVVLRFCFVNWRTTVEDVDEVVNLLRTLASGM